MELWDYMKQKIFTWAIFLFLSIFVLGCTPVASSGDENSGGSQNNSDDIPLNVLESRYVGTYSNGDITFVLKSDGKGATSIKSFRGQEFEWQIISRVNGMILGYTIYGSDYLMVYFNNGAIEFTHPLNNDLISLDKQNDSEDTSNIDFSQYNPSDDTGNDGTDDGSDSGAGSGTQLPQIIEIDDYVKTGKIPRLVIVANSRFQNTTALKKYITHKRKQGYDTVEKYYATGTTPDAIRNDLKSIYLQTKSQNQEMVVLLVGRGTWSNQFNIPEFVNKNQPSLEGRKRVAGTDLYYGFYEDRTTDLFPQVAVGRLSARNESELSAQVEKIIKMENAPATVGKNIVLVQQKKNDGTTPFSDESSELKEFFTARGYQANITYTKEAGSINSNIENGAFLVSYSGHGGTNFWGDSSYTTSNVGLLNNNSFYPVVLGVTCNSGNYTDGDACLAEAFMRQSNGGAIGYIGASNVMISYYSKAATVGTDTFPGMAGSLFWTNQYDQKYQVRTLGGLFLASLRSMKSRNYYNDQKMKDYSIEVLNLFGDPTYMPYTDVPKNINLDGYNNMNVTRGGSLTVTTNVPYAQVALTQANNSSPGGIKIIDAKIADENGTVTLTIPSGTATGQATLYAIAPNHHGKEVTINIQSASSGSTPSGNTPNSGTPESQPEDIGGGMKRLFAPGITMTIGWHDATKTGYNDSNLCWAATSGNVVAWWQDRYNDLHPTEKINASLPQTAQGVFEKIKSVYSNAEGSTQNGVLWYMANASSAGSQGGFLIDYIDLSRWRLIDATAFKYQDRFTTLDGFSTSIIDALKKGVIALGISDRNGIGHAITIWGAEYNSDTNLINKLYITDSDDRATDLKPYAISQADGYVKFENHYYGYDRIKNILILYAP